MKSTYKTIADRAEGFFKDRGSKFLAFAFPVTNEVEIKNYLDLLKKEYHDARHHCYAWKLGVHSQNFRANDDGEPSNSAGKPILNQLEKADLTNVLLVVVRYFGGTLLGVGGLITAYKTASMDCLNKCKIITRHIQKTYLIEFEYPLMNEVMKAVKDLNLETYDQEFEISCSLKLRVNLELEKSLIRKLEAIQGCSFKIDDS